MYANIYKKWIKKHDSNRSVIRLEARDWGWKIKNRSASSTICNFTVCIRVTGNLTGSVEIWKTQVNFSGLNQEKRQTACMLFARYLLNK